MKRCKYGGRDAPIVEPITVAKELLVQWSPPRIDDQLIRKLYNNGKLTTREVAKIIGISKTNVIRRLNEMGIGKKKFRGKMLINS